MESKEEPTVINNDLTIACGVGENKPLIIAIGG